MKSLILVLLLSFLYFPKPALAAPMAKIKISGKQNVVLTFTGIKSLKTVGYELTYLNNGKEEGVVGTIRPKKDTDIRTLYLGTCSKKVCTPHRKIKNGVVNVVFKENGGKVTKKSFKLAF